MSKQERIPDLPTEALRGRVFNRPWYDWFLWLAGKITTLEAGQSDLVIGVDVQAWSAILDGIANGDYDVGDLLYWNGSAFVPLSIGDTDQILTVIAGLPSWQDAPTPTDPFDVNTILTGFGEVLVGLDGNVLTGPA